MDQINEVENLDLNQFQEIHPDDVEMETKFPEESDLDFPEMVMTSTVGKQEQVLT